VVMWDAWKEPDGGWLQSFAIITTDPNELTATVHNRMPVIVKPSDYERWLTPDDPERPPVDLLRPNDAGEMTAYPVDPTSGQRPQQGTETVREAGLRQQNNQSATVCIGQAAFMPRPPPPRPSPQTSPARQRSRWN
jgi:putative SOS response-associated peptidase YedK